MAPLPKAMDAHVHLVEEAYSRGLILYSRRTRGGLEGDHFMVCPPLIVTREEIAEIMGLLVASLDAFADRFGLPRAGA
jgi:adenosylmethionine-8-amino-7-oxononanoate aminotransferase